MPGGTRARRAWPMSGTMLDLGQDPVRLGLPHTHITKQDCPGLLLLNSAHIRPYMAPILALGAD